MLQTSVAVLTETLLRSPRKVFILRYTKYIWWIEDPNQFNLEKSFTAADPTNSVMRLYGPIRHWQMECNQQWCFFKMKSNFFGDWNPANTCFDNKLNNFRGDLSNISAKTATLVTRKAIWYTVGPVTTATAFAVSVMSQAIIWLGHPDKHVKVRGWYDERI